MVVSNATDAKAEPAQSSSKQDQQAAGSEFHMSILLGTASAQSSTTGQASPKQPSDQQGQAKDTKDAKDAAQPASQAVAATAAQAVPLQSVVSNASLAVDPNAIMLSATADKAASPGGNPAVNAADIVAAGSVSAKASDSAKTPDPAKAPDSEKAPTPASDPQAGLIQPLKELTTVRNSVPVMPESATQDKAVSGSLVASKLAALGKDAQDGAVLPQTDKSEKAVETNPDSLSGSVAAQAAPDSKASSPPPPDPSTVVSAGWKASGQVVASASTDDGMQNSLQFADKGHQPSATQPVASGNSVQAFGVELSSQMDAGSTKQADAAAATIQADPNIGDKVVQQIVQQAVLQTVGDKSTLTIHLSPPELGSLKMNVTSQSGVLTTDIQSQSAAVRSLLETHLPALREALSNVGIEVKGMTVSSGNDFGQLAQGRQQAWQSAGGNSAGNHSAAAFASQSGNEPTTEPVMRPSATSTAGYSWLA